MSQAWDHAEIEAFEERQFYLEEFRGRALLFALAADMLDSADAESALAALLRALAANDTRVVLVLGVSSGATDAASVVARIAGRVAAEDARSRAEIPAFTPAAAEPATLVEVVARAWETLRGAPLFTALVTEADAAATHRFATALASRLRVHKLLLVDRDGGLSGSDGRVISFLDEAALAALLAQGEAEWTGLAARRDVVGSARQALLHGVASVNVCTLRGVARELFTYEGSGTLFTLQDYCSVERLGIDDFEEAERLIERGQREGVLKPRTVAEIALLIANGYGATIATHHLAGFCAFLTEPYRSESAGEIVGLYTITRFKGEGVGDRLLDRVLADARELGLRSVFATTTAERAQAFFTRRGFALVRPEDVPAAKWSNYDSGRKRRVAVLRRELAGEAR